MLGPQLQQPPIATTPFPIPQQPTDQCTTMLATAIVDLTRNLSVRYHGRPDVAIEARYNWYTEQLSTVTIRVEDKRLILQGVVQVICYMNVRLYRHGEVALEWDSNGIHKTAQYQYHNPQFPTNLLDRIGSEIDSAIATKLEPSVGAKRGWR